MPGTDQHLAYETVLRALDQQERMFDSLRTRAATLLAAGSLALSLFATDPAAPPGLPPMTLGALAAYLVCFAASLRVLIPTFDAAFSCSPGSVAVWERSRDHRKVYADVVRELNRAHAANGVSASVLAFRYRLAIIGLAVETFLLVAQLAANII